MRESKIEKALIARVRELGGECIKFVPQLCAGLPDRICLLPNGRVVFVELKRAGKKPKPLQEMWLAKLTRLGFEAQVIDNAELIKSLKI